MPQPPPQPEASPQGSAHFDDGRPIWKERGLLRSVLVRVGVRLDDRDPLDPIERQRVIARLFPEGPRRRQIHARFTLLTALSAAIAALGIISDSTAVVIGAMLVAPLLGPALGTSAAMVMGWPIRAARQGALIALGAAVAIALAALISYAVPGDPRPLPAELLVRTSPNLLDLGIALAAGAAGAYGQVRWHGTDTLTGVAVAVALVPPLIVVGMSLQLAEWSLALGAFYLFLANVAGIVVSAAVTFVASGFVPGRTLLTGTASIASGLRWGAIAVIIVALPMQFGRGTVLPPNDQTAEVVEAVEDFIEDDGSAAEVVNIGLHVDDGVAEIDVVLASPNVVPPATVLARYLAERLRRPVVVSLQTVTSDSQRASVSDP